MIPSLTLLNTLFDSLPLGVVVLNARGEVVIFNREEARLARRSRDRVIGRTFFTEIAPCMNVQELGMNFTRNIGREPIDVTIDFAFPFPFLEQPRDVTVRMLSFDVDGAPHACLLIQDISAQRSIERMKETLTSLLVHDFKNPLAVVLSNLQFAREDPALAARPDLVRALTDADRSAHRLHSMVVGLLDITRLERGEMVLHRERVDLRDLVRQLVEEARALGRTRGVDLAADLPPGAIEAEIDANLVRRALDNLVENAVRYSPKGGVVRLRAATSDSGVFIEVADQGPGIPEIVRKEIFEKYVQVRKATDPRSDNRGLGLTFVRLAARAHGGDATVDCPAVGGSVFRFQVPARAPAPTAT